MAFWQATFRWMHVVFGILWIGLLYWPFNFERRSGKVPGYPEPTAGDQQVHRAGGLFWFRWAALFTVLAGIGPIALLHGRMTILTRFSPSVSLASYDASDRGYTLMGIGVWLAIIAVPRMSGGHLAGTRRSYWGLLEADADATAGRTGRIATLASRTNALLCSADSTTSMVMYLTFFVDRLLDRCPSEGVDLDDEGLPPGRPCDRFRSPAALSAARARGPMSSRSMRLTIQLAKVASTAASNT